MGFYRVAIIAIFGALTASPFATASVIMFTYSGTISGTLNGIGFADSSFTITGIGNTANRVPGNLSWRIPHDMASVNIQGLGDFSIATSTSAAVNNGLQTANFANHDANAALIVLGPNSALGDWDLLTAIGPLSLRAVSSTQWSTAPIDTSGGKLIFDSRVFTCTFQATIVPTPATLTMLFAALGTCRVLSPRRRN